MGCLRFSATHSFVPSLRYLTLVKARMDLASAWRNKRATSSRNCSRRGMSSHCLDFGREWCELLEKSCYAFLLVCSFSIPICLGRILAWLSEQCALVSVQASLPLG